MKRHVMGIMVDNRRETAEKAQKTLAGWGCLIKTRLGIHDGVLDNCSDSGLILLELVGDEDKHAELKRKLSLLKGVSVEMISLWL